MIKENKKVDSLVVDQIIKLFHKDYTPNETQADSSFADKKLAQKVQDDKQKVLKHIKMLYKHLD